MTKEKILEKKSCIFVFENFWKMSASLLIILCIVLLPQISGQTPGTLHENNAAFTSGFSSPLDQYTARPDSFFHFEPVAERAGEGYRAHVVRLTSQRWLTRAEVKDPSWWHWLTIIIPDSVSSNIGLLFIGGGNRKTPVPEKAADEFVKIAMATHSVVTSLTNVPNQPMAFVGDSYCPRVEGEPVSYAWRQFLEAGGGKKNARWLPRLPMTNAAVRAMDAVTAFCAEKENLRVDKFVVAGGSKRGWTTWTTAVADRRVVAIMPIVIDMLNVVPSFGHHWQAYGFWAPAVDDYVREGVMEWQNSREYRSLMQYIEPYSFRERLTLPKFLINASGDQFFLPDSWQFYWADLKGEKHIRYVANANHSLRGSDALESIAAFHYLIINTKARPQFSWSVTNGKINLQTVDANPPEKIRLWHAANPEARDFRLRTIGKGWQSHEIPLNDAGKYEIAIETPQTGWAAFFAELKYPGTGEIPLKLSTGVVVVPDKLPYPPYQSASPRGSRITDQ